MFHLSAHTRVVFISASQGCPTNGIHSSLCPVTSLSIRTVEAELFITADATRLSVKLVFRAPGTSLSCLEGDELGTNVNKKSVF